VKPDFVYDTYKYGKHRIERWIFVRVDADGSLRTDIKLLVNGVEEFNFWGDEDRTQYFSIHKYLDAVDKLLAEQIASTPPG
jgi:hypothetical protein